MIRLLLKSLIFCWLVACGFMSWVCLNIFALLMLLSVDAGSFSPVSWLMAVTSGVTLFVVAFKSLKFDLVDYIETKLWK